MTSSHGQNAEDAIAEDSSSGCSDALVRRAVAGEEEAFREIYTRCSPRVYGVMVRMVGRQNADDLTQQAFLQVLRKLGQFAGGSKLETWLYRLAVNEALQFLRREKHRQMAALTAEPADISPSQMEDRELLDRLQDAIARLDPELRAILTLKENAGLSYREIAEAIGIPEGTVGSRLNRARADLRRMLEK